jgi:hypothetical protein
MIIIILVIEGLIIRIIDLKIMGSIKWMKEAKVWYRI